MASTLLREPRTVERTLTPVATPPAEPKPSVKPERLVSLDAYRGFIMLVMASSGFAFAQVVRQYGHDGKYNLLDQTWNIFGYQVAAGPIWKFLAFQFDHVAWIGCSFWDLIQPSFMFMVGVAMPYSYAARKAKGQSEVRIFLHTVLRAAILVYLGIFLSSNGSSRTHFTFVNVLTQIGLGYVFVHMLRGRGLAVQITAILVILVGYSALFQLYPAPADNKNWKAVGVKDETETLADSFPHWAKNANPAHDFDVWFLNLFPRNTPPSNRPEDVKKWEERGNKRDESGTWRFAFNDGGYQTLNFIPSLATMILGLMAGEMLRGSLSRWRKFLLLVAAGLACLALGLLAGEFVVPLVKRIWTPSWALYSTGWTLLILAAFFLVIDVIGFKMWAFPLVVVGMNSIAIYCMSQLMRGWVGGTLKTHLPGAWFAEPYGLIVSTSLILLVFWLICLWMYRRGIFLRI